MSALASGSRSPGDGGTGRVPRALVDAGGQTMPGLHGGHGDRLLSATCTQYFLLHYETHKTNVKADFKHICLLC